MGDVTMPNSHLDMHSIQTSFQNQPIVSIGMPVYNCARTVAQAICSILNQTLQDWELIIIDDSTDNTSEIIASFRDPRIIVIRGEENTGLAARLNDCVGRARGKYFARMDGDDIAYPERLRKQVEYLERHPKVDLLGAGCVVFRGDGEAYGLRCKKMLSHAEICGNSLIGLSLMHPTWVGKIEWFLRNQYRCDFPFSEDRELLMRTRDTSNFFILSEPLLGYREDYIRLLKLIHGRYHLSRAYLEDAFVRGHLLYGLGGVIFQLFKAVMDVIANCTGLQHKLLRHHAPYLPDEIRREWNAVWRQNANQQTQVVQRKGADYASIETFKVRQ
jgi:glycosyltransferase involved in cell wall biosynthesis